MLHCSTVVFAPARNATWVRAVGYQSVFIFAVPIFFMVSGANLLGYRKRYSTRTFLKRRLSPSWLSQEVLDPHLPQETPEQGRYRASRRIDRLLPALRPVP